MERIRKHWFVALLGVLSLYAAWMGSSVVRRGLFIPENTSSLYGWDTSFYYFWLRSAALDFDIDFENDLELCNTLPEKDVRWAIERMTRTDTGMVANKYPIGWAVFEIPFFLLGHGTSLALDQAGVDVRTDGFGKVYEAFLYVGALFYAAIGLWLTYLLLRRYFEPEASWAALLSVWLAGFLIYYQLSQYAMSHNFVYLCVVSSFYWALAIREMPPLKRNWAMLGLSVGLLLITRPQAGLYLLFPFFVVVLEILRRKGTIRGAAVCTFIILLFVSLQLAAWKALYGSWIIYSYQGEGFRWGDAEWVNTLFSPHHGLMYWQPVFAVGTLGLIVFVVRQRDWQLWWIPVSFAAVVYLNAAWETWWYGVAFGGRAYEGVTLFATLGVAGLLQFAERMGAVAHTLARLLLLALVVWNIGVLEVFIYNWQTGISVADQVTYGEFWEAIRERWF